MDVGIKRAKTDLSRLVALAQTGRPVFLVNRGKRVAQIIAIEVAPEKERGFGMFKHLVSIPRSWGSQRQREADEKEFLAQMEDLG